MPRKKALTSDTSQKIFPTRLRELMEKGKISQPQLAAAVGVQRQTISNYACGQSSPDWETLVRIAEFFDVSSDYLLGISDVQKAIPNLRMICDYTGLNIDAVNALHSMKELAWYKTSLFSLFVEHFAMIFLRRLQEIEKAVIASKNKLSTEYAPELKKTELKDVLQMLQVSLYRFDTLCHSIPDSLFSSEKVMESVETEVFKLDVANWPGGNHDLY